MALDPTVLLNGEGYAIFPSAFVYRFKTDAATGKQSAVWVKQLLFGDFIRLKPDDNGAPVRQTIGGKDYVRVRARSADGTDRFVRESDIQPNRILEVNFIDVGQGDGCHIVTPDDQHFIVDAGPGDNMYRFLKWRFNLKGAATAPPPFTVVVSHSDADHYRGFKAIFTPANDTRQQFKINKVYHNGLAERSGEAVDTLGTLTHHAGTDYITDLCDNDAAFRGRAAAATNKDEYLTTLSLTAAPKEALQLNSPPLYNRDGLRLEVIGPVAQPVNGKPALPVFARNKGKTKNGHSVILKLTMGKVRMLLGGDLNEPAEDYLMKHYTGTDLPPLRKKLRASGTSLADKDALRKQIDAAISKARPVFEAEVAKSCHHGSADFTSEFMRALNPLATIISSGDNEPHVHPRPDTLGTIGKHSRGERSLIFSTELARSSKEFLEVAPQRSQRARERVVIVYGMINVRTDGERIIIAQKLEKRASRGEWDIHELVWNPATQTFEYQF
jgi:beta-lactamase superfamily II metal-dependent hydrolase